MGLFDSPTSTGGTPLWVQLLPSILGAGAAVYGSKEASKPQPMTPEQKWLFEEGKKRYNYSPERDYVSSIADTNLRSIYGGTPSWTPSFQTDYFKNQQLPTLPKVDFSQLPTPWSQNRPGQPGAGEGGNVAGGGGGVGGNDFAAGGNNIEKQNGERLPDLTYMGSSPEGDSPLYGVGFGPKGTGNANDASPEMFAKAKEWLDMHPRETATLQGAIRGLIAAGIPGGIAYSLYTWWKNRGANPTPVPGNTATLPPGPGVRP